MLLAAHAVFVRPLTSGGSSFGRGAEGGGGSQHSKSVTVFIDGRRRYYLEHDTFVIRRSLVGDGYINSHSTLVHDLPFLQLWAGGWWSAT